MAFTVYHNNPVVGSIAWSDLHIQYKGVTYAIADGYTNSVYAYWTPAYPNNLVVSDSFPTLGVDDCLVLLNKSGIALIVPTASVTPGDLIVPGTIMSNAIAANAITSTHLSANAVTAGKIATNAVTADTVAANAIGAEKIAAGAIIADKILTGAVTTDKIAASAVTSNKILAGTITADRINISDLFAAAATINAIRTMTVKSIEDGATLVVNKNVIRMEAPSVSIIATGSEDGQEVARFDPSGGHFRDVSVDGRIDCDMLAWRYTGPSTYANVTSMVSILDALNRCYLDYDVTITLASGLGTISEAIEFIGIHGPGKITLNGNTASAPSGVKVTSCSADITFHQLYAAYTLWHSPYCRFVNCSATGSYTASGTETKNASPTRTKLSSSSWRSDTDYVWQGYTQGTGRNYATFWFPGLSAIASATIKSASVRLKRVSGIGKGDTVDVVAYTAANTSPSGNFTGLVSRGQLGGLNNGETKTFSLAPAAAAVLCAGGCLVLDPGDTTTLSGKVYSSNYCKFYGQGTGYEPVLTVTYEIAGQTVTKQSTFSHTGAVEPEWKGITLTNGTSPGSYGNGALRVRKIGNRVSVVGGVNIAWSASTKVCDLPYAPKYSNQYYLQACSGGNVARVFVTTAGVLQIEWIRNLADGVNQTSFNAWVDLNLDFWTD